MWALKGLEFHFLPQTHNAQCLELHKNMSQALIDFLVYFCPECDFLVRFVGSIHTFTYEHMSLKVMRHFWLDSNLCHQRQYKAEISEFLPTQQWCSQTIEHAWFCVFRVWALWWQHCEILGRWSCDIVTLLLLLLLLSSAHCVCIRSGQGTFGDKMELLKNSTWVFKGQFVIPFFSHKRRSCL